MRSSFPVLCLSLVLPSLVIADTDQDGWNAPQDCNDQDAAVHPQAPEICDQKDNDCDGIVDENCAPPPPIEDCWDLLDNDGDGLADCCDPDCWMDFFCLLNPISSNEVVCDDGYDEDCDGLADCDDPDCDQDPVCQTTCTQVWYLDADGDGWGDPSIYVSGCSPPHGHVAQGADCDDQDATIHPYALETCDGVDENCNGLVDDGCTTVEDCWDFVDNDGDGFADCCDTDCMQELTCILVVPTIETDCNNGFDEDCDGLADCDDPDCAWDLECPQTCLDEDGDGWDTCADDCDGLCENGVGCCPADCDDHDAFVYPGAPDVCDGKDNDCDGVVESEADADQDGFLTCEPMCENICCSPDCDDMDPAVHPCAPEACDGLDNDCDGEVDPGCHCTDSDGDGVCDEEDCNAHDPAQSPVAEEVCDDGLDNDCDGDVDEGCGGDDDDDGAGDDDDSDGRRRGCNNGLSLSWLLLALGMGGGLSRSRKR